LVQATSESGERLVESGPILFSQLMDYSGQGLNQSLVSLFL